MTAPDLPVLFSGTSPSALCDAAYFCDERPFPDMGFRTGSVVFCKVEQTPRFFERLRLTRRWIILVTAESDCPCDERLQRFLPPHVVHWFSTNVTSPHPRVSAIPLGIGRSQDKVTPSMEELAERFRVPAERSHRLYVNFRPGTNRSLRQPIYDWFQERSGEGWLTFRNPETCSDNRTFLDEMSSHRFVLCPPGNGVDTHRFWETLSTGGIPVAARSAATAPFGHLPAVFVDDFREVTASLLDKEWDRLSGCWSQPPEIGFNFWRERVEDARKRLLPANPLPLPVFFLESFSYACGIVRRRISTRE